MKSEQLTRWKREPVRWRRPLRSCAATAAVSALLVLSACSGDPDIPETVGPTSTPDEPDAYVPTLPPYTSQVELSPEDEEDVEELLLLIEQFGTYTSDVTNVHQERIRSIEDSLSDDMKSSYHDFVQDAERGDVHVVGSVVITDTAVWRYESKSYAMVAICYRYDHWAVIENESGQLSEGHDPDRRYEQMAYVEAELEANGWLIYNQKFYADSSGCNDIR